MSARRFISVGVLGPLALSLAVNGGTKILALAASPQRAHALRTAKLVSTPEVRVRGNPNVETSNN